MIGARIRQIRRTKHLSLSELARRAGVSKSMISQIEHDSANPSIETVRALASALEVPIFALFLEKGGSHSALVRKSERITVTVPGSESVRELFNAQLATRHGPYPLSDPSRRYEFSFFCQPPEGGVYIRSSGQTWRPFAR